MHFFKRFGKSSTARSMTSWGIAFHALTKLFFSASIDWWGFEHASFSKMLHNEKSSTHKSGEFGGHSPLFRFGLMSTSMHSGKMSLTKSRVSSARCDGAPSCWNTHCFCHCPLRQPYVLRAHGKTFFLKNSRYSSPLTLTPATRLGRKLLGHPVTNLAMKI